MENSNIYGHAEETCCINNYHAFRNYFNNFEAHLKKKGCLDYFQLQYMHTTVHSESHCALDVMEPPPPLLYSVTNPNTAANSTLKSSGQ